jgi:fucose permease
MIEKLLIVAVIIWGYLLIGYFMGEQAFKETNDNNYRWEVRIFWLFNLILVVILSIILSIIFMFDRSDK